MGTAFSIYEITASPPLPVAQFTNANIIGPNFESDSVPKISAGQYAVITINVEKLGKNKIDDILIKSYVENPDSRQFFVY